MSDPKQPEKPGSSSESHHAPKPYLSPKLREKLEGGASEEEWSPKSGPPIAGIVIGVLALAVLVGGVFWLRASSEKHKAQEAAQARADSLAAVARAESLAVAAARADSIARADSTTTKPGTGSHASATASRSGSTSTGGSSTGSAPPAPPAPTTDGFGISVGTYMNEERANGERDRLAGVSGLSGIVVPGKDGGETVYRVILGKYSSRGAAESKAQALMDSSMVRVATVVARPKTGS